MVQTLEVRSMRPLYLAANFALLSGGELFSKVVTAVAFAYLARVLGPSNYGQIEFALAVTFFLSLVVDSGLGPYGAREIAKDPSVLKRLTAHVLLVRGVLAISAFALLIGLVAAIDKPATAKNLIALYGLTLFAGPGLLSWVFQGRDLMHYIALASIIRWTSFAVGVLFFIRGTEHLARVPLVEVGALLLVVLYYVKVFTHHFGSLRQQLDWRFALSVWRGAMPIGASELVWAVKVYFATVLIGIGVGGLEVGWFGAAHRVVIALHSFVFLYFFNLLPSLGRCAAGPPQVLHDLLSRSIEVVAWVAVFVGLAGATFAEPIIMLLYGPEYAPAGTVFGVLIWMIPLAWMSGHYRFTLIAYDRQRLELLSAAGGALLNVVLNLVLLPAYGLLGAALALVASEAFIWALALVFVRRTVTSMPLWPHVRRPLLAGIILAGLLIVLRPLGIWMTGLLGLAAYGLTLAALQPTILTDLRSSLVLRHR